MLVNKDLSHVPKHTESCTVPNTSMLFPLSPSPVFRSCRVPTPHLGIWEAFLFLFFLFPAIDPLYLFYQGEGSYRAMLEEALILTHKTGESTRLTSR